MKSISRFAILFVLFYALCLLLFQSSVVSKPVNQLLKGISTGWIAALLPSADISSQQVASSKSASDIYIVYGNPVLIQAAKEYALKNKQQYATLPTKSMEIHLFEMYIVPVFFLLSLFVATPMSIKNKTVGIIIGVLILVLYILIKLLCLSLFEISNAQIGIYELSDKLMRNLSTLLGVLSLGLTITLAFVIWLIFGFRKSSFADNLSQFFK